MRFFSGGSLLLLSLSCAACGDGASADEGTGPGSAVDCSDLDSWDPEWAAFEDEVLRLVNEARATGHDCDSAGSFGATSSLSENAALRCAARRHSRYMAETGDFGHEERQTGSDPFERIESTGYDFSAAGENVAAGQRSAAEVVAGWLDSDGHCRNIMEPMFSELGVGYALSDDGLPYWTQVFASPL